MLLESEYFVLLFYDERGDVAYTERLNRLGLPTLELGRLQLDLIFCYKIFFGLTSLTSSDYFSSVAIAPQVTLINYT